MKIIYLLVLTLFLASCGNSGNLESDKNTVDEAAIQETTNQINEEINNLKTDSDLSGVALTESSSDNELNMGSGNIVKLDATYSNQNGPVDMGISYSLSESGIIESIEVTATTYDMKDYNKAAQVLVGKTLEDAKKFEVAGASLTNEAFKKAIK